MKSMNASRGHRRRATIAVILGLILAALMVYPWPEHTPEPIILGVISAPLFFWFVWVAAFVGYVAWICYRWDPYAAIVHRAQAEEDSPPSTQPAVRPPRSRDVRETGEDR